jgi:hypothetical protein
MLGDHVVDALLTSLVACRLIHTRAGSKSVRRVGTLDTPVADPLGLTEEAARHS